MTPDQLQMLLDGPALARPEGVAPGPLNQGNHALGYGIVITSCVLCGLAVAVRLTSRISMKKLRIEDFLIVCALVRGAFPDIIV